MNKVLRLGLGAAWKSAKVLRFGQSKSTGALQLEILDLITWKARSLGIRFRLPIIFQSCVLVIYVYFNNEVIKLGELNDQRYRSQRQGLDANEIGRLASRPSRLW